MEEGRSMPAACHKLTCGVATKYLYERAKRSFVCTNETVIATKALGSILTKVSTQDLVRQVLAEFVNWQISF